MTTVLIIVAVACVWLLVVLFAWALARMSDD